MKSSIVIKFTAAAIAVVFILLIVVGAIWLLKPSSQRVIELDVTAFPAPAELTYLSGEAEGCSFLGNREPWATRSYITSQPPDSTKTSLIAALRASGVTITDDGVNLAGSWVRLGRSYRLGITVNYDKTDQEVFKADIATYRTVHPTASSELSIVRLNLNRDDGGCGQ